MKDVFAIFDTDGTGKVTKQQLKAGFTKLGDQMSDDEINELFNEADKNKNGYITYAEFKVFMSE